MCLYALENRAPVRKLTRPVHLCHWCVSISLFSDFCPFMLMLNHHQSYNQAKIKKNNILVMLHENIFDLAKDDAI